MRTPRGPGLTLVVDSEPDPTDVRVRAVLEVLAGESVEVVAQRWVVEPGVLVRWRRTFLEAGGRAVVNAPDPDAARQRDRFLAAFAHELRTPLTVAKGWTMMLADGDLDPSEHADTVERLQTSLQHLADRTADVEQLAAASLGRLRLRPVRLPLAAAVAHVEGLPELRGPGAHAMVEVDPEYLGLAVRDLWVTASRTAPAPRALRLEAVTHGPWVELRVVRVADPIEPVVLQALFDPFDLNDDDTGVTIGLYLARALAVAHGGVLGLEQDDAEATFWLRLPACGTPAPPAPLLTTGLPGTSERTTP
ncbi:MAG: histidine kinase [Marmoricola sp.]|nr:histidine kinase [Marmoricola sp.]